LTRNKNGNFKVYDKENPMVVALKPAMDIRIAFKELFRRLSRSGVNIQQTPYRSIRDFGLFSAPSGRSQSSKMADFSHSTESGFIGRVIFSSPEICVASGLARLPLTEA
jgi:hypothetical protein